MKSISDLDNNTVSVIPHEMIECLNIAAREWITNYDQYIIVMGDGPYAIQPNANQIAPFYNTIKQCFGVDFNHKLLHVNMPKHLFRDYLTNVVLYHELGHFIDVEYKITEAVAIQVCNLWANNQYRSEIDSYFNCLYPLYINRNSQRIIPISTISYIREYIADLFASQYVKDNVINYLVYEQGDLANNQFPTHPSLTQRLQMICDFISGNSNVLLDLIQSVFQQITSQKLSIRYTDLSPDDFYSLVPLELENESDIHSIFVLGWDLFKTGSKPFEERNGMQEGLFSGQLYEIINNLIEKSINNYLMLRDWNHIKP